MNANLLILIAKEPELCSVKTRLAASIGDAKALEYYKVFLKEYSKKLNHEKWDLMVYYKSSNQISFLQNNFEYATHFTAQCSGDLGDRLIRASLLAKEKGYARYCLIGADSPDLPLSYLEEAFTALESQDMVIGPVLDGGYYLLGADQFTPSLFSEIPWSTNEVYNKTLNKAKLLGMKVKELPSWYDIDHEDDLKKWLESAPHLKI